MILDLTRGHNIESDSSRQYQLDDTLSRQNPYRDSCPRLFSGGNGADEISHKNQANSSTLVDSAKPTLLTKTTESIEKLAFSHCSDCQLMTQMISLCYGRLGFVLFSRVGSFGL